MSWRRLVAIGAIALAVRIVYVALFMRGYSPMSDADSYLQIAQPFRAAEALSSRCRSSSCTQPRSGRRCTPRLSRARCACSGRESGSH